jgi:two-component system, cell cycle response regulator
MPATVLLVDDERFSRTVYSDYLRAAGYEVQESEGAQDAIAAMRKRRFDLLVTDLVMPGANGLDLLAEAKRLDPTIQTLVVTSIDRVDTAVRAMKSGASDYLVKPVTPEALQHAAQSCLSARALLAQNTILRSHLELFERCQRISAAVDRERAISTALDALTRELGAAAAVFVEADAAPGGVVPGPGVAPERAERLATAVSEACRTSSASASRFTVAGPGDATENGLILRVADDTGHRGSVGLVVPGELEPQQLRTADFVCSHLALALRALGHLQRVEHLAYLDDLTTLYNTRFLNLVLDREIAGGRAFTLLFLDLDEFKSVNDQHGHLVGSKLLVEVGRVLKACVRDQDVVARYGGDEYAALLLGTPSGGAVNVAERIRRSIEQHVFLARERSRVRITASIGVASFPEHGTGKAEILDLADRAMYRGKRSTRNTVHVATRDLPPAPAR